MKRYLLYLTIVPVVVAIILFSTGQLIISASGIETTPPSWPSSHSPAAQTGTTAPPDIDLIVRKSASPSPVYVNFLLTYTIVVENKGTETADDVVLTDSLPLNIEVTSVDSSQGSCSESQLLVVCNLNSISGGGKVTVTIVVVPTEGGVLTNRVQVASSTSDPNLSNNRAEIETTALWTVFLPSLFKDAPAN